MLFSIGFKQMIMYFLIVSFARYIFAAKTLIL